MANSQDLKAHEQTYASFISAVKVLVPLAAIVALIVVLIISN